MSYRPTYEEVAARVGKARVMLTEGQMALCMNGVHAILDKNLSLARKDENPEIRRRHEEIVDECVDLLGMLSNLSNDWSARFNAVERGLISMHKREVRHDAALKAAATRAAKKLQK